MNLVGESFSKEDRLLTELTNEYRDWRNQPQNHDWGYHLFSAKTLLNKEPGSHAELEARDRQAEAIFSKARERLDKQGFEAFSHRVGLLEQTRDNQKTLGSKESESGEEIGAISHLAKLVTGRGDETFAEVVDKSKTNNNRISR